MSNETVEMDLEVYTNAFICGIKDFKTKKVKNLEISDVIDQRQEIYDYWSNYDGYLVTFNGINYDEMLLKYYLSNWKKFKELPKKIFLANLKMFSDKVINNDRDNNWEILKTYAYQKTTWTSIDLFLYWAKMLRMSKKISLKSLGIQLGYPVVQELPYKPETILTIEELSNLRNYNNEHDLGILDLLCEKMRPEIKLRLDIRKEYSLHK